MLTEKQVNYSRISYYFLAKFCKKNVMVENYNFVIPTLRGTVAARVALHNFFKVGK